MTKVRYWDNLCARWMMRHFYILFFQFVLVVIFFMFFVNTLKVIDLSTHVGEDKLIEQLLLHQSSNTLLIVLLLILNSFWTLFIFNGINRLRNILREINYNLSRRRNDRKPSP